MTQSKSEQLRECLENVLQRKDIALAVSIGTPSPFRKITAMIMDSEGKVLGYAKIGENRLPIERIKNEASVLKELAISQQLSSISIPECLYDGELGEAYILIQSSVPFEGISGSSEFNEGYAQVLSAIIEDTKIVKKFSEAEFFMRLKEGIENYSLSYRDILKKGLVYLEENVADNELTFALSHGDFAPWNILRNGKEVFLYDWESASLEAPAGIDLIHFLFQTGFLLRKMRGRQLLNYCMNKKSYQQFSNKIEKPLLDLKLLSLSYLLKMAITEDELQQLSVAAVERRNLMRGIVCG